MTQSARVLAFIATNPGCSTMDITLGLSPFVSNPRARISDLRAQGHVIRLLRRPDGHDGYVLHAPKPVDRGVMVEMGL